MKIKCLASSSSGNCYTVDDTIMIDCGISAKEILARTNYKLPSVCLITHSHRDHSFSHKDLNKLGVKIYCSNGCNSDLNSSYYLLSSVMNIKGYTVTPFPVVHGDDRRPCREPLGFMITKEDERLVFITDTARIDYSFQGVTHFVVECNYDVETLSEDADDSHLEWAMNNHLGLTEVYEWFKTHKMQGWLKKTKAIYLAHLSDKNSNERKMIDMIKQASGIDSVFACQKNGGFNDM